MNKVLRPDKCPFCEDSGFIQIDYVRFSAMDANTYGYPYRCLKCSHEWLWRGDAQHQQGENSDE